MAVKISSRLWGELNDAPVYLYKLENEDGPYIELMTGMFTDNQPDFTWLMPNEEKHFTQYFMPYRELGVIKNVNKDILIALDIIDGKVQLKVYVTCMQDNLNIKLKHKDALLLDEVVNITPEQVYTKEIDANGIDEKQLIIAIYSSAGKKMLQYDPADNKLNEIPQAAKPALQPADVENTEQLFLTGQHLEQYRHATYSPVPYYEEALHRDPKDIRNNNALGLWYLRHGQFAKSEPYFRKAMETSIQRNPNPYDGECYYNLGMALKFLGRTDEAYKAFYKATWSNAWKDSGYFSVAQIDLINTDYQLAVEHSQAAIDRNANNSKAYVLQVAAYRKLQQFDEALTTLAAALKRDPFNLGALFEQAYTYAAMGNTAQSEASINELVKLSRGYYQNFIEYALDYAAAGLFAEASDLLRHAINGTETNPMVYYYLGYFQYKLGNTSQALAYFEQASTANSYLCFPDRLEDIEVLKLASQINESDAKAPYYLGNLFYDKLQYDDAITAWKHPPGWRINSQRCTVTWV